MEESTAGNPLERVRVGRYSISDREEEKVSF
jgi:hypothetical protein